MVEDQDKVIPFLRIIQETIVPYFLEPLGKHVVEKKENKFFRGHGDFSGLFSVLPSYCERHSLVRYGDYS